MSRFEQQLFEYFSLLDRKLQAMPLILGGAAGSGGGYGGRPGGFIGVLPQTRVAYDMSELAVNTTPISGSLLDNLNHIRYRLSILEGGSGTGSPIDVYDEGVLVESGITIIDFVGDNVTVTNPLNGRVTVTISGITSSGGGDMYKSVYDTDNDNKVESADTADSVPWTGVSDKPSTFAPENHADHHISGGSDTIKLDDLVTPDDNTDLNATTDYHGLLPKLTGSTTNYLRADGTWATPSGTTGSGISGITVRESDLSPSLEGITVIEFEGATISDQGGGVARVTISGITSSGAGNSVTTTRIIRDSVYATAEDSHTNNSVVEDINGMSVTLTTTDISDIVATFTWYGRPTSANWEYICMKFSLDGTDTDMLFASRQDVNANTGYYRMHTLHWVWENVSSGEHTIKARWADNGSSLDYSFYERRLTVMALQDVDVGGSTNVLMVQIFS